jgi:hypothetical protein
VKTEQTEKTWDAVVNCRVFELPIVLQLYYSFITVFNHCIDSLLVTKTSWCSMTLVHLIIGGL